MYSTYYKLAFLALLFVFLINLLVFLFIQCFFHDDNKMCHCNSGNRLGTLYLFIVFFCSFSMKRLNPLDIRIVAFSLRHSLKLSLMACPFY
jgi:hypothetical protein